MKHPEQRPGIGLPTHRRVSAEAKEMVSLYLNLDCTIADKKRKLDELGLQPSREPSDILESIKQLLSEEACAKAAGRDEDARRARRRMLNSQAELYSYLSGAEREAGAAS